MADGLYIGMSAATSRALELDSVADNLANAQTPGFKAARPAFESFLAPSGAPDKVFPAAVATGVDPRAGQIVRTGNGLDLLPEGNALFAVRTNSGGEAYTRAGHITVDANGQLLAANLPILDKNGAPIVIPPQTTPSIDALGKVTAGGREVGQIGMYEIDGNLSRQGPQLLTPGTGANVREAANGRVRVGELEVGNYSALEATVQMVSAQRHFDSAMQALQTYRSMDQRANELGRIR